MKRRFVTRINETGLREFLKSIPPVAINPWFGGISTSNRTENFLESQVFFSRSAKISNDECGKIDF